MHPTYWVRETRRLLISEYYGIGIQVGTSSVLSLYIEVLCIIFVVLFVWFYTGHNQTVNKLQQTHRFEVLLFCLIIPRVLFVHRSPNSQLTFIVQLINKIIQQSFYAFWWISIYASEKFQQKIYIFYRNTGKVLTFVTLYLISYSILGSINYTALWMISLIIFSYKMYPYKAIFLILTNFPSNLVT